MTPNFFCHQTCLPPWFLNIRACLTFLKTSFFFLFDLNFLIQKFFFFFIANKNKSKQEMQNLLFNFETKILLESKREALKEEEKRWRECECTVRARERVCAPHSVFEKECVWVRTRERERERETGKKPECPSLRFSSWRQTQTSRWKENKLFLALG